MHCATIAAVSLSMFSSNKEFTKAMALLCSLYNVNLSEAGLETISIWIEGIWKDVSWNLRMSMAPQPMAACWSSSSRGIADGKEEGAGHGLVMSRQMLKVISNEHYRVTGVKSVAAEQGLSESDSRVVMESSSHVIDQQDHRCRQQEQSLRPLQWT